MIPLFFLVVFILSSLLTIPFAKSMTKWVDDHDKATLSSTLLHLNLTSYIILAIIGSFTSFFYYFEIDSYYLRLIFLPVGILLCILAFSKRFRPNTLLPRICGFSKFYAIPIGIIFLLSVIHLLKTPIPWFDQDEISQYGYYGKLIKNGWTYNSFTEIFGGSFPKFGESINGLFYSETLGTFPIRLLRWYLLIISGGLIYSLSRLLNCSVYLSLVATAVFLATPELSYLSVSLKTDGMIMGFEIAAISFLVIARFRFQDDPNKQLRLVFFGFSLSAAAFSTRSSGIYLLILSSLYMLYLQAKQKKINYKVCAASILVVLTFCNQYLFIFLATGNPLFPINGPWMAFFPNGQFWDEWQLPKLRESFNMIQVPIIIQVFYLPIHLGLGLETTMWNSLTFIPHAKAKGGSYGWLTPCFLALYLLPFYWRSKRVRDLSMVIIFLYIFWVMGVHYSRVLLATSSCIVVLTAVLISESNKYRTILSRLFTTTAAVFLCYHTAYFLVKFPHDLLAPIQNEARYNSNKSIILNHDFYGEDSVLSFRDVETLEKSISQLPQLGIGAFTEAGQNLHVFFNSGFFLNPSKVGQSIDSYKAGDNYTHLDCAFLNNNFLSRQEIRIDVEKIFSDIRFISTDGNFEFRCRPQITKLEDNYLKRNFRI